MIAALSRAERQAAAGRPSPRGSMLRALAALEDS
jgi:hypothetical protein